jgi:hypothetical protein
MYSLIHESQLILGPIGYNYRLINSDLEELEVEGRVSPRDYENVPLQIDEKTYVLPAIQIIPPYDSRFQDVGNFEWKIIKENEIPVRVEMTYEINDKTLDQIKEEYKTQVSPIRKKRENTNIQLTIDGTNVPISTSRENRMVFVNKLLASPEPHKFKFGNELWVEITKKDLEYIISQIDSVVQAAFDWEYQKLQEIDACTTAEEVYNVILVEPQEIETPNALSTNN